MSERHDWAAGALTDREDEADWLEARAAWAVQHAADLDCVAARPVSTTAMVEHFARERREVEDRSALEHIAEKALHRQWQRDLHHTRGESPR
jgi:hypothetical protein